MKTSSKWIAAISHPDQPIPRVWLILAYLAYTIIALGIGVIIGQWLAAEKPVTTGILTALIMVGLLPIYQFVFPRLSFRKRHPEASSTYTRLAYLEEVNQTESPNDSLRVLFRCIQDAYKPETAHIFLLTSSQEQYQSIPNSSDEKTTDLEFALDGPIPQILSKRQSALRVTYKDSLPVQLHPEIARLNLLGARLIVPLFGDTQLTGWIVLGDKSDAVQYSDTDLIDIEWYCSQTARIIEHMLVANDLHDQIRELQILTRAAHGINVTLAYDDMLELVYAQTLSLLPIEDFSITLSGDLAETFEYAIFITRDERIPEIENKPLDKTKEPAIWVIREGHPLRTSNYKKICLQHGFIPEDISIQAWMSIPLFVGSETIGAISVSIRDPQVTYTTRHQELLQTLADQAAGAIIKARLLEELERRAHQLTILNEIGRSLTSTLETRPLLDQILHSAVEILNCEAGTLFMVDPENDELVFEVTAGPVAENLVGHRVPSGVGLVGEAVRLQTPIIANHVQKSPQWYQEPDRETGFITRDLLVVPLLIKDTVIGVIEVINKADGSPFIDVDQELLNTFASQAAIALDNARLYTQTDQALSARVAEMSIMQRIDRALNTSLDINQSLTITLNWAIQQTSAVAGGIFIVRTTIDDKYELQVGKVIYSDEQCVSDGLGKSILSPGIILSPDEFVTLNEGLYSSKMIINTLDEPVKKRIFYPQAPYQVLISMRRENSPIALLVLEFDQSNLIHTDQVNFLSRLVDHATIAISNALLYADLAAANIAKSEFVSLVSHELKTPMTSIKGYADLLVQGAVGPVNDAQTNFLNTIRTNVNRMATLVSDLADVSRIEANRMRLDFGAVQIQQVIDDVLHSVQTQIDQKQQELVLNYQRNLPVVWGDYNRLVQIVANLISNAHKYSGRNGNIEVSANTSENLWDPDGAPQVVHIAVKDAGYGISPEDQAKIFQKFFRSEEPNIRESPGTGLGLNITRHLVEMQGGKIWFESAPGTGTTFHFTIPVAAVD